MTKVNNEYRTPMDLIKRWLFEREPENSFLYKLQEHVAGVDGTEALNTYMNSIRAENGMYNNHADEQEQARVPETSHDQLTAYIVYSILKMRQAHKIIWKQCVKRLFTYDNISGKINLKRILHPRDILFYGCVNYNPICLLLSPLLYLMGLYTYAVPKRLKKRDGKWKLEKKNSNEILWWLRMKVMPKGIQYYLFKFIYGKLIQLRFGSLHGLMMDYYDDPEHPVCVAAQGAKF